MYCTVYEVISILLNIILGIFEGGGYSSLSPPGSYTYAMGCYGRWSRRQGPWGSSITTSQIKRTCRYIPQYSLSGSSTLAQYLMCYSSTGVANSPAGSGMDRSLLRIIFKLSWSEYELRCVPTVDYAYMHIQERHGGILTRFVNYFSSLCLHLRMCCGPESSWSMSYLQKLSVAGERVPHYHGQVSQPLYTYSSIYWQ